MSRDAVIVSAARTAIGKAYRGAFNATSGATLGSFSLKAAVERAGIDGAEVDDVLWGSALQQGTQGGNLARQVALRAGLPVSVRAADTMTASRDMGVFLWAGAVRILRQAQDERTFAFVLVPTKPAHAEPVEASKLALNASPKENPHVP